MSPSQTPEMPSKLAALAARARPTRLVVIDVEQPLPELRADDRYQDAWVVVQRRGLPRAAITIDLTAAPAAVQQRLAEGVALAETAGPNSLDAPALPDASLPRISVVVPTIVARTADVATCIAQLERLEYPDFEVLLVDNRRVLPEVDPLPGFVEGRPWLRVVRETRPGISAARNAGVAAATGTVIAFTDDDVRVDPQWLRAIGTRMAVDPGLDAVAGLILPAELDTAAQIWFERYYGGFNGERTFVPLTFQADDHGGRWRRGARVVVRDSAGHQLRRFAVYGAGAIGAGANIAFRKGVLDRCGGFDTALGTGTAARGGEDLASLIGILWSGGRIGYEPAAVVHHRHRREYAELLHQLEGNGLGFTAMLTALVLEDPRHLLGLASQLPLALERLAVQVAGRVRGGRAGSPGTTAPDQSAQFPPNLVLHELAYYPRGPFAYAKSRRVQRTAPAPT